jgi:predicted ATPase/class 3 adenylate cyclase
VDGECRFECGGAAETRAGESEVDIGDWLRGLGLQSYEQAFRDHAVDMDVLPLLTIDDLREIGIAAVGHRRRILDAIKLLEDRTAERAATHGSAERRQLTLVFVDLVGSTELSARLDPEEFGETLQAYRDAVAAEIVRFEGHVAKFLGDGVLAYFGWPRASEDAAERAIRAGLAIAQALGDMASRAGERLSARVGIATGLVVVGDLIGAGPTREDVAGDTPNLAARLQQVAPPNGVVIAESTRRLVGGLFELAGPDTLELKGFAEPVTAWRVVGQGGADSRFEALHGVQLTPLVGRGEELDGILSGWAQAKQGDGQIVLVCGEAGIGKSRLVHALREALKAEPITWIGYDCSPQHSSSALHPFIKHIERTAQFAPGDSWETRLKLLDSYLREGLEDVAGDEVALFADLLGISNGASLPDISPEQKKARLFRSLLARLEAMARRSPVLIVLEDAHWLDPTSGELFDQLVQRLRFLPVLLVVTSRPEFSPTWTDLPYLTSIILERLQPLQAKSLIERVANGKALPPAVLDQILERTEGIPLFAEELTRAVLETGLLRDDGDRYTLSGPLPPLAIPATLQDSLMARLDRLAPVKEIAQIGACIGREFDHQLVAAVVPLPERDLAAALDRLSDAGIIFRRGAIPAATYVFKHALVRDAAYESLLKRRRQELHERVATALLEHFPQLLEAQPELLARHLGEAGLFEKAAPYWLQAGRRAAARSANVEAIAHLNAGIECLQALPSGESRSRLELSLQLALGGPLLATKGFASSEAEAAYQRARDLSRELQSPAELFVALRGLGFVFHVRANLREATALADETVALAEQSGEPGLLTEGYHLAGALTFHLGRFQTARRWLDRSMEAGEDHGRYHSEIYGMNMGVFCRAYIGHCDWHLGYPVRALRSGEEGLAIAREVSHPFSIALALAYLAMLRQFRREPQAALELAEEARDICATFGFDYYRAWSDLVRAWAVAAISQSLDDLAGYEHALESFRGTGAGLRNPHYLGIYAAMHRKAGDVATGLRLIEDALAAAEASHESWCRAELHRERGELLLAGSQQAERQADADFQAAIEIAAMQGARLPELRATVARARLLAAGGDWRKARDTLTPIYRWFSEGLETPDLVEAQRLLADLQ